MITESYKIPTAFAEDCISISTNSKVDPSSFRHPPVFARRVLPPWLPRQLAKLDDLTSLQPNWDSYGASAVDRQSIEYAKSLIQVLAEFVGVEAPAVGATPDGEAGLSWDGGPWSLDVDVMPNGAIHYVYINEKDRSRDEEAQTTRPSDLLPFLTGW